MSNVTTISPTDLTQRAALENDDPFISSVIPLIPPFAHTQQSSFNEKNAGISLDAVLAEFEQWRASKSHSGIPIPDALWVKLFQLASVHSSTKIRALFNISGKQYQKKWDEFFPATKQGPAHAEKPNSTSATSKPELYEIKLKPPSYQSEPLPSAKTMIVEFYRTDGQRMSIHITQDSITEVLQAFFKG